MPNFITIVVTLCTVIVTQAWAAPPERSSRVRKEAERALVEDPMDAQAFASLLRTSADSGGLPGLIDTMRERAEAKPRVVSWRIVLGHLLRHRTDCRSALPEYETALAMAPENAWGHRAIASCQNALGEWQSAIEHWEKAIVYSKQSRVRQTMRWDVIEAALQNHTVPVASRTYKHLVRADPSRVQSGLKYAEMLKQHRHFEAAANVLKPWIRKSRSDPKSHIAVVLEWAHLLAKIDRFPEAENRIRKTVAALPREHWGRVELYDGLVTLYRNEGRLQALVSVVEAWPSSIPNQLLLAQVHEELGNKGAALKLYRSIVRKRPGNRTATTAMERLLRDGGNRDALIRHVEKMARRAGNDPHHALDLAKLYFEDGSNKKALVTIKKLTRRFSGDPGVQESILEVLLRSDVDSGQIVRAYKRLIRLEPNDPTHRVALGEYLHSEGQTREALAIWDRMVSTARNKADALVIRARTLAEHRMIDGAVQDYERVLELNPKDFALNREMALMLEQAARLSEALQRWEVLLEHANTAQGMQWEEEAQSHIIDLHKRLGTLASFIRTQQTLLKNTPGNRRHGLLLGQALLAKQQWSAGEKVLRKFQKTHRDDAFGLSLLIRALEGQNKGPQCLAFLRQLARLDPDRARDAIQRFAHWEATGEGTDQALQLAQLLVDLNPTDAAVFANLGDLYHSRAALPKALSAYRRAASLDATNAIYRLKVADILQQLGRRTEYVSALGALLRTTDDDDTIARTGKQILQLAEHHEMIAVIEVLLDVTTRRRKSMQHRNVLLSLLEQVMRAQRLTETPYRGSAPTPNVPHSILNRTIKPILDGLDDPDLTVRSRCLQLLHSIPTTQALPRLIPMLQTPDSVLRSMVIAALAHIGHDDASPALAALLKRHDQRLRIQVIWALGAIDGKHALDNLLHLPKHRNMSNELNTVWAVALGQQASTKSVRQLSLLAEHPSETVRRAALWALGRVGNRAAIAVLIARLPAESPTNQRTILAAMSPKDIAQISHILMPLCVGNDPILGTLAWRTLQRWVAPETTTKKAQRQRYLSLRIEHRNPIQTRGIPERFLPSATDTIDGSEAVVRKLGSALLSATRRLIEGPDSEHRYRAVQALLPTTSGGGSLVTGPRGSVPIPREWHEPLTQSLLSRLSVEPEAPIRRSLLDALAYMSDSGHLDVFRRSLHDKAPPVIRAALHALGRSKTQTAAEILLKETDRLFRTDWLTRVAWVRSVGEALGRHTTRHAEWSVLRDRWLADPHIEVRVAVWAVLQKLHRRYAPTAERVRADLAHGDERLAVAVIEATMQWPANEGRPILTEALTHKVATVRERARRGLTQWSSSESEALQRP